MATIATPAFPSTKETTNYARLCRLLVDVGSQALRDTFDAIHPPVGLHTVLGRHPEHATLKSLRNKRILNATQWGKLYPTIPSSVSSAGFDITLLMVLLRNICKLAPPSTGWDSLPHLADVSKQANIARLKYYRNTVYGHASQASVDDAAFNNYWQEISNAIVGLVGGGGYGAVISKLRNECMDPDTEEHYRQLLKQWKEDEDNIKEKLQDIEDLESSTERKREEQQQTELSRCLKSSISTKNVRNQEDTWYGKDNLKKVVFDWTTRKHATGNCFTKFVIVLLIKCRDVQSDLWEAIEDQLLPREVVLLIKCRDVESGLWEAIEDQILPREVGEDERERFFDFIRHNQSNVLLILDGLDEVSEEKLAMFSEVIEGRVLPNCRVVATARHEAGVKVRKYCDTLLEVEGFTEKDVQSFIRKYFKDKPNLAKQLTKHIIADYNLYEISTNPLNAALLCLVYEDLKGVFPESRTKLYMEMVECVLRRYRTKQQLPENGEDLVDLYESQLKHLGSIALKGLLEDNLDFDEKELRKHKASDLPGFGFLSVQPGGSRLRPTRRYGFLHKTFQEFFAAFYLSCQLIKKEIGTNSIGKVIGSHYKLKEVLLFTFGMLAARCEETAANLLKIIATTEGHLTLIRECVDECKKENKDIVEKLGSAVGASLQIEFLGFSGREIDETLAVFLSNFLKTNTIVTTCDLRNPLINVAAALAEGLKYNTSLTTLNLYGNKIGHDGAAALGECLKYNTSLTWLDLNTNEIGDDGAAALGEGLKYNTSLTTLNLYGNKIGDDGAAALGESLKYNKSLTTLYLDRNKIGHDGAAALGECLKSNKSLTTLYLHFNKIGDDGAAALVVAQECHPHLTILGIN
ncbi:hypothetical protein pdam_00016382 [Pocillopora damicornis]|uniref:NACHT domain-containing protein n=1 Tax=Pocillopora damicornis TaxID=46731 RepID=A0A3M6V0C0_POCDA|nr:hypothetical protein pdam_00016382 [Pocillopora damicornis]